MECHRYFLLPSLSPSFPVSLPSFIPSSLPNPIRILTRRFSQGGHAPAFSQFATYVIDRLGSDEREALRNYWKVDNAFVIEYHSTTMNSGLSAPDQEEAPQVDVELVRV